MRPKIVGEHKEAKIGSTEKCETSCVFYPSGQAWSQLRSGLPAALRAGFRPGPTQNQLMCARGKISRCPASCEAFGVTVVEVDPVQPAVQPAVQVTLTPVSNTATWATLGKLRRGRPFCHF